MKNQRNIDELAGKYADLLEDNPQPGMIKLVGDLDTAFADLQPSPHIAASMTESFEQILRMRSTAGETTPRTRSNRGASLLNRIQRLIVPARPFRRPGMVGVLVAVLLVLAGAGYGILPALERLFEVHTGTGAIIRDRLGQEVNIARTVNGFTVAVKRVYADPNQIVIGLVVSGPSDRTFNHIIPWGDYRETGERAIGTSPVLTDSEGRQYNGGMGGEQGATQNGTAPYLLVYDGPGIAGIHNLPAQLNMKLTIGELSAYERVGSAEFRNIVVHGPFTFDLTIPLERGRVADVNQTVWSNGMAATLERVVTSPTGTRVLLRGAGPNADVRLKAGNSVLQLHPPDGQSIPLKWTADSTWEYVSGDSLLDVHGQWELTVLPSPGSPTPSGTGPAWTPVRPEGVSWTFRFVMP